MPDSFLVIDDSKLVHQMYRLIFSRGTLAGSTVHYANNGREGYALLAVHPDPQQQWSSAILADVVIETIELAKLRLVDLQAVAWAGRFLPATYVPDGDVPGALTLDFKQLVEHWHAETSRQELDA